MFAHLFGIMPWDIERLDLEQWKQFKSYADQVMGVSDG